MDKPYQALDMAQTYRNAHLIFSRRRALRGEFFFSTILFGFVLCLIIDQNYTSLFPLGSTMTRVFLITIGLTATTFALAFLAFVASTWVMGPIRGRAWLREIGVQYGPEIQDRVIKIIQARKKGDYSPLDVSALSHQEASRE